jgi:hypothetical protein
VPDLPDNLDSNARVRVRNEGTDVAARRILNFHAGSNTTLTVADDPTNEEIDVTIGSSWVAVTKTADESVASSTTLQNDDELFFTVTDGASYEVEAVVVYASPAGGATPDLKVAFGEDGVSRGVLLAVIFGTTDVKLQVTVPTNQADIVGCGTSATKRIATLSGSHQGAGGTFRMLWAQNTFDANATTIYAGSLLRYRRII